VQPHHGKATERRREPDFTGVAPGQNQFVLDRIRARPSRIDMTSSREAESTSMKML